MWSSSNDRAKRTSLRRTSGFLPQCPTVPLRPHIICSHYVTHVYADDLCVYIKTDGGNVEGNIKYSVTELPLLIV